MANTAPRSLVRVITPNKEQGREKNSAAEEKGEFSCGELEKEGGKDDGDGGSMKKDCALFYLMVPVPC